MVGIENKQRKIRHGEGRAGRREPLQAFEVQGAAVVAFENVRTNCFDGETEFGCSGQFDCWCTRKKIGIVKGNWKKRALGRDTGNHWRRKL